MLDEPQSQQRAPDELNRFTVQNYLLMAHMAALRLLLQRYADNQPRAEVEATLERAFARLRGTLGAAAREEGAPHDGTVRIAAWRGWAPLRRRLRLLQQDAEQVAVCHGAIDAALGRGLHRSTLKKSADAGWN
jgi:hypothetical protein